MCLATSHLEINGGHCNPARPTRENHDWNYFANFATLVSSIETMLTALGHIQLLRYVGPAAVMLVVAPQYLLTWIAWRLASLPLPSRVYQRGDEFLYDMYQSLVCFFFETCTGAEVNRIRLKAIDIIFGFVQSANSNSCPTWSLLPSGLSLY